MPGLIQPLLAPDPEHGDGDVEETSIHTALLQLFLPGHDGLLDPYQILHNLLVVDLDGNEMSGSVLLRLRLKLTLWSVFTLSVIVNVTDDIEPLRLIPDLL